MCRGPCSWTAGLLCPLVCNDENPCEGMSRHATFENFGMAFLTLFQVSTGDNWNGIMKVLVGGLGREDSVWVLRARMLVRAPQPSACPVPHCTQEGGQGPEKKRTLPGTRKHSKVQMRLERVLCPSLNAGVLRSVLRC